MHADGTVRWVAARGRVLADPDGRQARMLGAAYDTTDVHSAAERLGRVLETMSTAFFTLGRDWRFTYVNAAAERMMGRGRNNLVGLVIWRSTPTSKGPRAASTTAPRWRPASRELRALLPAAGSAFDVRVTPNTTASTSTSTTSPRGCAPSRSARRRSGVRRGDRPPADPGRGSARLAGTLDVDELLRILCDIVLNGFGEGLLLALEERRSFARPHTAHHGFRR